MSQCPKCGLQMGLHHSVLPGCTCGTSAPFTYPIQPQKRQWVGLTDKDIIEMWPETSTVGWDDIRLIEAKLKEKNA
jgi:hypothetical protein